MIFLKKLIFIRITCANQYKHRFQNKGCIYSTYAQWTQIKISVGFQSVRVLFCISIFQCYSYSNLCIKIFLRFLIIFIMTGFNLRSSHTKDSKK